MKRGRVLRNERAGPPLSLRTRLNETQGFNPREALVVAQVPIDWHRHRSVVMHRLMTVRCSAGPVWLTIPAATAEDDPLSTGRIVTLLRSGHHLQCWISDSGVSDLGGLEVDRRGGLVGDSPASSRGEYEYLGRSSSGSASPGTRCGRRCAVMLAPKYQRERPNSASMPSRARPRC